MFLIYIFVILGDGFWYYQKEVWEKLGEGSLFILRRWGEVIGLNKDKNGIYYILIIGIIGINQ